MRHPHARLYVHLVWSTWDRAPLITPEIHERIYPVMQHQASRRGAQIMAMGGIEDHVHVLARFPTTLSIADLVGRMKGASSHMVTQVMGGRSSGRARTEHTRSASRGSVPCENTC